MEKKSTKVDFSPISCKKAPFYIVNWTFKGMLLLSYSLRSIINLAHAFKSPIYDVETTSVYL